MPQSQMPPVFRFAPSPNGHLHLGHAYSALLNEKYARQTGGKLLLRIEDVDRQRSRSEFEASILDDLAWLGIMFDGAPRRQSEHLKLYQAALESLIERHLAYRSAPSRSEIAAMAATDENWPKDPDGAWLPPAHKHDPAIETSRPHALRLNMERALALCLHPVSWHETNAAAIFDAGKWGDVVLKNRDGSFAYHLAVVVDDAAQNITHVVRGQDLYAATAIHCVLQTLLGFPKPNYEHHPLIMDANGEKLAKSRHSPTLKSLRAGGISASELRERLGF